MVKKATGAKTKWVVGKTVWDRASNLFKTRADAVDIQNKLKARGYGTKIRKWRNGWVVYIK